MKSLLCISIVAGFVSSAAAQAPASRNSEATAKALSSVATDGKTDCKSDDPNAVVVCGRSQQRFRIDPNVLAATRRAEALPPKAPLDATGAQPCTGSQCGGGDFVPLIPMALKALKATELAIEGDDWREAFRTRPDQYQAYRAEQAKKGKVSVSVTAGHH